MGERSTALRADASHHASAQGARLAEATAMLAVASDLATGTPLTTTLRITLAALRIADLLNDDSLDRRALYYYCQVRLLGCTVENSKFAATMGNEFAMSQWMKTADRGSSREMMAILVRAVGAGEPPLRRMQMLASAMASAGSMRSVMAGHCEVSRMLAEDLRLGRDVATALDYTYERWDGKGMPRGVRGGAIPLISRVMHGAYEAVVQDAVGGGDHVIAVARKRSGGELDPDIAAVLADHADDILAPTNIESPWDAVLAAEPGAQRTMDNAQVEATASAIASFADLKSDYLGGHSSGVARIVETAARARHMDAHDVADVRRAALIHDLGRVGITSLIWDKPAPLTDDEWEEVRLHPYHTERIAGRVPWLARSARIAAMHHERLDGDGYHRGCHGSELSMSARLLAAADSYHALTEPRPHRPARTTKDAADVLREEVSRGRLEGDAVKSVLEAAGHTTTALPVDLPAGLTDRELDVLRIIGKGATIKQAAAQLHVSPKTVDTHVQHIYSKIGCSTRSGATVFAMREGLLEPAV